MSSNRVRSSNIELFRILLTLLVVAHHYVLNSELWDFVTYHQASTSAIYLQSISAWGKPAINGFMVITGYFMATSSFSIRKYLKILLQLVFYSTSIYLLFCFFDSNLFSWTTLIKRLFQFIFVYNDDFTGSYLIVYLLSPFLNLLIHNLNKRWHCTLLAIIVFFLSFSPTFITSEIIWFYPAWLCVVYLTGAYLRLYPPNFHSRELFVWGGMFFSVILFCLGSMVIMVYHPGYVNSLGIQIYPFYYFHNSNKFFAYLFAISGFMFFKNLPIKESPVVNRLAASSFGVFLIHSHDVLRPYLWKALGNANKWGTIELIPHSIFSVLIIYIICFVIDQIRNVLFERPLFYLIRQASV